jgi:phosphohistidine phosphatase
MNTAVEKQQKMKKVILVRHSNAEDQLPELSDFERSLTSKGKIISKLMAEILKSHEKNPGLLLTSPAFRAYETAMIFCQVYGLDQDNVEIIKDLYFKMDNKNFIKFFRSQSDKNDTITLFGHNPLISEIAQFLASGETEDLPKTGIIGLSFPTDKWRLIEPGSGTVDFFLKPKTVL